MFTRSRLWVYVYSRVVYRYIWMYDDSNNNDDNIIIIYIRLYNNNKAQMEN